ncbi:MAG TPA: NIPSNAP family protein [Vicinamibacteria bacterium]|nr:NIPSNAP family protein [Vicinamibacteria bacterium]
MDRRGFLGGSLAASWTLGAAMKNAEAAQGGGAGGGAAEAEREYYELRTYRLRIGPQKKALDDFLREAAVPAWNRLGISPVGVFDTMLGPESPSVHVLLCHKSAEALVTAGERLASDAEFQKAASSYMQRPAAEAPYIRYESSLLRAFDKIPRLEVPASKGTEKPRIFELRIYESPNEVGHTKKIEMFTRLGELAIFRRTGLTPVFFGQTLVGSRLPNFVYMLTFESVEARQKAWGVFVADPEWKKVSSTPGYTDAEIMSGITNVLLRPAPYSQV